MKAGSEEQEPEASPHRSPLDSTAEGEGSGRTADRLLLLCWTALVIGLFWPFLSGQSLVGYRDSVQFYWPMFRWADAVWAAGEVPLWNPHDGLGRSHLAEGSSSLFYPGKLLFWARWCSFESRYGWYLALHVWLAGWGAGWLAGRWGADWTGRGLAILSYGLAGPVLFASTNVIYLVSAAWLPWGIGGVRRWCEPGGRMAAVRGTATCAALMVLGGDPQMAGNLLMLATGSWCWWSWSRSRGRARWQAVGGGFMAGLATLALVGALAAVQIVPSWQLSSASERVGFREPRSGLEWLLASWRAGAWQPLDSLWQEPELGTHEADIYEFSQPPWTVGDWLWPSSSGRPFPEWTHWVSSVPGAGRMWQPSLYQGLLPLLLAWTVLFRRELRWLAVVGGLALLAAFGWYGPVWGWNELGLVTGWWQPLENVNRAAGGVYWWLVCLVPGYAWFRYPAKLMIVTALMIAILAACGWTVLSRSFPLAVRPAERIINWLLGGVVGFSAGLIVFAASISSQNLEAAILGDEWFGPFCGDRFRWQLAGAGVHGLFVSGFAWWIVKGGLRSSLIAWRCLLILGLSAGELLLANAWLLSGVNVPPLPHPPEKLSVYWAEHKTPVAWRESSSRRRLSEVVNWEVNEAFPRLHWLWNERMLNAPATIEPQAWQAFLGWLAAGKSDGMEEVVLPKTILFEEERVWVLSDPQAAPPILETDWETDIAERYRLGLVEGKSNSRGPDEGPSKLRLAGQVTRRTTQTVELEVELAEAGVVFLAEAFAAGWRVSGRELSQDRLVSLPCLRVGHWLRGVRLEPGRYQLRLVYSPPEFYWCAIISGFAWLIIVICRGGNIGLNWKTTLISSR